MKVDVEFKEPEHKRKIKRIIAKEGLIAILLLVGSIFILYWKDRADFLKNIFVYHPSIMTNARVRELLSIHYFLWIGQFFIFCYLLIMFIRFIIWAVRTLKKGERI